MNKQAYYFYPVWDPLLRILHWWNASTMLLQVTTGSIILILSEKLEDGADGWLVTTHAVCGYLFAAGILTRILWLFVGSPTASWRDILPLTANQRKVLVDTLRYYASALRKTPPLYLAHNTFAGLVYAVFFLLAGAQAITGAILLNLPPDQRDKSILLDWHEAGYFLLILYVAAHVFAVFVHEWAERHGLIPAMIHGKKTFTQEEWLELDSSEKNK
ncbi:MAG: cytochrome b/b6 domain-containing protein [Deltaproteobacteria bacterium]|nr:cytochrome b/b6 domain-containing protein [Deltaproteobacteria bacterium]